MSNERQNTPNQGAAVKATAAAKDLAKEGKVDLTRVKPTGADGDVTKPDVEEALKEQEEAAAENAAAQAAAEAESGAEEEARLYEAVINPDLPGSTPETVRIGAKVYANGTPITQEEADSLKQFKSEPTFEHPGGVAYVKRGKEIVR